MNKKGIKRHSTPSTCCPLLSIQVTALLLIATTERLMISLLPLKTSISKTIRLRKEIKSGGGIEKTFCLK